MLSLLLPGDVFRTSKKLSWTGWATPPRTIVGDSEHQVRTCGTDPPDSNSQQKFLHLTVNSKQLTRPPRASSPLQSSFFCFPPPGSSHYYHCFQPTGGSSDVRAGVMDVWAWTLSPQMSTHGDQPGDLGCRSAGTLARFRRDVQRSSKGLKAVLVLNGN